MNELCKTGKADMLGILITCKSLKLRYRERAINLDGIIRPNGLF
jgi:hypothetical protein